MFLSTESILNFGGALVCEAALIDNPKSNSDLTLGYRYVLHSSEHQKYQAVGEGFTIEEAYSDLYNRRTSRLTQEVPDIFLNVAREERQTHIFPKDQDNWTLSVYNPNMREFKNIFNSGTDGIDSDLEVVTSKSGNSISMGFQGRNGLLQIDPRDMVQLSINEKPTFFGINVLLPGSLSNNRMSPFKFWGAKKRLDEMLLDEYISLQNADAIEYIREIARSNLVDSVGYNEKKISGSGVILDSFPNKWKTSTLNWVFQSFAIKLPNASYGIDAEGDFFFRYRI